MNFAPRIQTEIRRFFSSEFCDSALIQTSFDRMHTIQDANLFAWSPHNLPLAADSDVYPPFKGKINVHYSAVALFCAPSDLSGAGGMKNERIRSTPSFHGYAHRGTVFVVVMILSPEWRG